LQDALPAGSGLFFIQRRRFFQDALRQIKMHGLRELREILRRPYQSGRAAQFAGMRALREMQSGVPFQGAEL